MTTLSASRTTMNEHQEHTWVRLDITDPSADPGWEVCSQTGCHAKQFVAERSEGIVTEPVLPQLDS